MPSGHIEPSFEEVLRRERRPRYPWLTPLLAVAAIVAVLHYLVLPVVLGGV